MSTEMKKLIIGGTEYEIVDDAGRTRITALEQGGGTGLTQTEKNLLLTLFEKAAYAEDDANTAYTALSNLWTGYSITWSGTGYTKSNSVPSVNAGASFTSTITANTGFNITAVTVTMGGETVQGAWSNGTVTIPNVTGDIVITVTTSQITVSSISVVYTQSGTVYDTDSLDSLKSDLVVTATFMDSSTGVIDAADYTLSGTLTVGTSTITVSYAGLTTTFNVTVTEYSYITDGLVMWLDGEYNSTNGTHATSLTTWVDQTGNGWDWTNRGGATVSTKSIVFSGGDTSNFNGSAVPQNVVMMELVYKVANNGGGVVLAGFGRTSIGNISIASATGKLSFHTSTGSGESTNTAFEIGYDDTIHSVNSAGYVDGEAYTTTTSAADWQYANPSVGYYRGSTGSQIQYKYTGEIYCIRLYSRVLTAAEIAHNFAIDAERFGIGAQ